MYRQTIFANGYYYHIFNRGVAGQPTFSNIRDYQILKLAAEYYRFNQIPLKLSLFRKQNLQTRQQMMNQLYRSNDYIAAIIAFAFMPNHFHFLLRQEKDRGITRFMSQVTNSYTRYYNIKHNRTGHLFQGSFKAVRIETEEQLVHVSRYIHINPLVGIVVPDFDSLLRYPWSSMTEYLNGKSNWVDLEPVMSHFKSSQDYKEFLEDQVDYAKSIKRMTHLLNI